MGKIAFDSIIKFYKLEHNKSFKNIKFGHGEEFKLPDKKILIGCYHPSPRNVNTGRIDFKKFISLLRIVKKKLSDD